MHVSNRVNRVPSSPIRKLIPFAKVVEKTGIKIHYLNIGQPDIPTPPTFFEKIKQTNLSVLKYENSQGNAQLIQTIQTYFKRDQIELEPDNIIITSGGSEAMRFALLTIADPGDEILLPEPYYVSTGSLIKEGALQLVAFPTIEENKFHLPSFEVIEQFVSPKTKAIILTNPNNPTGTVYTKEEIKRVIDLAIKYDLFIISDEVYRKLVFEGRDSISLGTYPEISNRLIIVDSVSKRYSSCGARIGCVISKNKEVMQSILKLAQSRLSVSTIDQIGAIALYELDEAYIASTKQEYEKRRQTVYEVLKNSKLHFTIPEGAFYMIITLPVSSSEDFAKWMLTDFSDKQETLLVAPACDFYANPEKGKQQIRLAFVCASDELRRSIELLVMGVDAYQKCH
ncbi:MAG: pyridoxal phosphate-dependent aminotransferase [Bacilli bacterium]|nr:pyridoxal phosphate-dependent aminotransferase [Bacilli bacterium]